MLLASYKTTDCIYVDENESSFLDFEIKNDKVYIKCYITLTNKFDVEKTVNLSAKLPEDVTIGLLTQEKVMALNEDGSQKAFLLPANSSESFDVVFIGKFAGTNRKHDKLLPEIIIEIAEQKIKQCLQNIFREKHSFSPFLSTFLLRYL